MYNHIDWWIGWYLDDYVELDREQQRAFDDQLEKLHSWHRKTQLVNYVEQLKTLKNDINQGVTPEGFTEHQRQVKEHWRVLMTKIAPEVAELSTRLTIEQRQTLKENITKIREKRIADHEKLSREQWLKEREKEQVAELKEWVGQLTSEQQAKIHSLIAGFETEYGYWLAYRKAWQQEFFGLLEAEQLDQAYVAAFTDLMINGRERLRNDEFKALIAKNDAIGTEILVSVLNSLNQKQRKTFNRKIDNLIEDLTELIND